MMLNFEKSKENLIRKSDFKDILIKFSKSFLNLPKILKFLPGGGCNRKMQNVHPCSSYRVTAPFSTLDMYLPTKLAMSQSSTEVCNETKDVSQSVN